MKNFIVIFILFLTSCTTLIYSQCPDMTVDQYRNIKFNNHLLSQIVDSHAASSNANTFFSESFTINNGNEPSLWKQYISPNVELFYDDGRQESNSPNGITYTLTIIDLKTSIYPVNFNGYSIRVGDNVNILGNNPTIITYNDGSRSACYKIGSESLAFFLRGDRITRIRYQYYN